MAPVSAHALCMSAKLHSSPPAFVACAFDMNSVPRLCPSHTDMSVVICFRSPTQAPTPPPAPAQRRRCLQLAGTEHIQRSSGHNYSLGIVNHCTSTRRYSFHATAISAPIDQQAVKRYVGRWELASSTCRAHIAKHDKHMSLTTPSKLPLWCLTLLCLASLNRPTDRQLPLVTNTTTNALITETTTHLVFFTTPQCRPSHAATRADTRTLLPMPTVPTPPPARHHAPQHPAWRFVIPSGARSRRTRRGRLSSTSSGAGISG